MGLKRVNIKDFRGISSLTVQGIPDTARLIILVGPNGCGKSSFVDALYIRDDERVDYWDPEYHQKYSTSPVIHRLKERWKWDKNIDSYSQRQELRREVYRRVQCDPERGIRFHARSAFRNDVVSHAHLLGHSESSLADVEVRRMMDNDAAIARNYRRLASKAAKAALASPHTSTLLGELEEQTIKPISMAFSRLFPEVNFDGLGDPIEDGAFQFSKVHSHSVPFQNLASGEKAAFDLILDFVMASEYLSDDVKMVYSIDEPEAHLHAHLQSELLSVLYDLILPGCQLLLATHSIGMMRRARDIEVANPGSVVFLDFSGRDFDEPQVVEPAVPDRAFWERAYEVALDDLAALVAPERIVICEGEPKNRNTGQNYSHDARCYERIFKQEFPETQFIPGGNAKEVAEDGRGIAHALGVLAQGTEVTRLIDRDARSPEEIAELGERGTRVLSRRNLESYLFDDEVLRTLAISMNKGDKAEELLTRKADIVTRRSDTADDLKPASGEIYLACKETLGLTHPGNDTKTFMRDTLAPVVKPGIRVYAELKSDVFGT